MRDLLAEVGGKTEGPRNLLEEGPIPAAQPESSIAGDVGRTAVGTLDSLASTAHGFSMFLPTIGALGVSSLAGLPQDVVSAFGGDLGLPGGTELRKKALEAAQSITLKPGMIEEAILGGAFDPEKSAAVGAGELISSGFDFFLPIDKIEHNLSRMKELGVPAGVADQVAFWWAKQIEFLTFSVAHKGGSIAAKKINNRLNRLKKSVDSGDATRVQADADAVKDLFEKDPDVKAVREEIERGPEKTPIQPELEAREAATRERTNREAKESLERRRDLLEGVKAEEKPKAEPGREAEIKSNLDNIQLKDLERLLKEDPKSSMSEREIELFLEEIDKVGESDPVLAKELRENVRNRGIKGEKLVEEAEAEAIQDIKVEETRKVGPTGQAAIDELTPVPLDTSGKVVEPPRIGPKEFIVEEDANLDYEILGKKRKSDGGKFDTIEEAQVYIEDSRFKERREDLQAVGTDLEVIKIGDKYQVGEPLARTGIEEQMIVDYLSGRTRGELAIEDINPKAAEAELRDLGAKVQEWHQGNRDIDIVALEDRIATIGNSFIGNKVDPTTSFLVDASDRMLQLIGKGKEEMAREAKSPVESVVEAREAVKPTKTVEETFRDLREQPDELFSAEEVRGYKAILDDVIDVLKPDGSGDRGSYRGQLPYEKLEAIRRLTNDAKRAGKTVAEFMTQLGYSAHQALALEKLSKEISQDIDTSMASVGTEGFHTGEQVNVGRASWVDKRGNKVKRLPVFEGEKQVLKDAKELRGGLKREIVPMIQQFEETGSRYLDSLRRRATEGLKEIDSEVKVLMEEIKELERGLTKQDKKDLGIRAIAEQENGIERLGKMGITEVPELSPRANQVFEQVRENLKKAYRETNEVKQSIGKSPMREEPNYFTFMYSESMAEKLGLAPNAILDQPKTISNRYGHLSEMPFKYSKVRSKLGLNKPLDLDYFGVYERYMRAHARHKALSPLVAKVYELGKPLKDGVNAKGKPKYYNLQKDKPNLYNALTRWGDFLAGRDVKNPLAGIEGKQFARLLSTANKNLAVAMLGGNLRSAGIQVSALRNSWARLGTTHTTKGIVKMFQPGEASRALRTSDNLSLRTSEVAIDMIMRDLKKGRFNRVGRSSFALLQYLDSKTAAATWLGAESFAKSKLKMLDKAEIKRFADDVVTKTQASSLPSEISPIQRTALGKTLTMFQTFTINDWNFFYKEVLGKGRTDKLPLRTKIKRSLDFVIATTLFNMFFEDVVGVNSPFPTPIRAAVDAMEEGGGAAQVIGSVFKELIEPLPIIGGPARYGSSPAGPLVETVERLFKSISDPTNKQKIDGAGPLWEEGFKLLGVPGVGQLGKSLRAAERGESPMGIALGTRSKKRKTSSGGFGKF